MPTEHIDSGDIGMTPEQEREADAALGAYLADRRTELAAGAEAVITWVETMRYALDLLRHPDPHLGDDTASDIEAYLDGTARVITLAAVAERTILAARVAELEQQLRAVYRERAHFAAHLAAQHRSVLDEYVDMESPEWPVLYVDLPTGQASWHIAPDDLDLFAHVERAAAVWDGHTTAEKYARLDADTRQLAELHGTVEQARDESDTEDIREARSR